MADCLVLGSGVSGRAALRLAAAKGYNAVVLDGEDRFPSGGFDFAVVSPGIPLCHPWLDECRRRRIPFKSELQFGCEELVRHGWKLLAVTGSKGKSSVVKVVADAISLSGVRAVPCGNYGHPVSDLAADGGATGWAVVEVSSFMMEKFWGHTPKTMPKIRVLWLVFVIYPKSQCHLPVVPVRYEHMI